MRILLYDWNSYLQYDIKWICMEKGILMETFAWEFANKNEDEAFEQWFCQNVDVSRFDVLFSVNYWPMLSKVAQKQGLKYAAWCYDNPLNVMHLEETLANPVNYVFFFDRIQTEQYIRAGFDTVYYLPLGVNSSRLGRLEISGEDHRKYHADVTFVGSLYESRLREFYQLMDDYTRGYLEAALVAQHNLYGYYLLDDMVTDDLIRHINDYIQKQHPDTPFRLVKEALTFAMASEVTRKDRLVLLTLLGRRFDTHLYSFQSSEILQNVKCFPPIDYISEMPKVFSCSKININPILRCIQSGIPLRALDIMGVGGFLLSSYQLELEEQFEQEKELVLYESMEDAVAKTAFYLRHDDIRTQISVNGRRKVLENYSLQSRLCQILETAGLSM